MQSKDIGSLLRREGLYASQPSQWRKQRSEGVLIGGQQAATEIAVLTAQRCTARCSTSLVAMSLFALINAASALAIAILLI